MITTTLNRIHAHSLYQEGWEKLLNHLGKTKADDEPLPFSLILEINGLDYALWWCRAEPQYEREWRLFAVACARRVEHLNSDPRVKNAIDVAERYANGEATSEELNTARDATWDAAWAAKYAAYATWDAAGNVVGYDAWDAEREWQKQEFLRVVTETEQRLNSI